MNDLIGKKIGKLKIIDVFKVGKNYKCKCICECGKEYVKFKGDLFRKNNRIKNMCCTESLRCKNLNGMKFGKLSILNYSRISKTGGAIWNCRCECGTLKEILQASLHKGITSCGKCINKTHILKRFNEKVEKSENCWIWKGFVNPQGYGTFKLNDRSITAHRASWIIHNGEIPVKMYICHKCDIKSCVNPDHLYIGTAKDNVRDAIERGQHPKGPNKKKGSPGEKNIKAKLNLEKVEFIRKNISMSIKELSEKFKVSETTILNIRKGKTWSY